MQDRDKRFGELKRMLLEREYSPGIIDAAIEQAKQIPRSEALRKVIGNKERDRPVLVIHYDPRLPSITKIIMKHYRTMVQDPHMKEVFPKPHLVA